MAEWIWFAALVLIFAPIFCIDKSGVRGRFGAQSREFEADVAVFSRNIGGVWRADIYFGAANWDHDEWNRRPSANQVVTGSTRREVEYIIECIRPGIGLRYS